MLDPIAEDLDNERRIKKAQKEAKLLKEEKKKQSEFEVNDCQSEMSLWFSHDQS